MKKAIQRVKNKIKAKSMDNVVISGNKEGLELDIGDNVTIEQLKITVRGTGNKIKIFDKCRINNYIFVADGSQISIGVNTIFNGLTAIHAHESGVVYIGSNCLFANNVILRPSDAHKIFDIKTDERLNPPSAITISDNVWIGEQVTILKGSYIPAGSVVGIRSIVTKKFVESNAIYAGVPAKYIKGGIYWKA